MRQRVEMSSETLFGLADNKVTWCNVIYKAGVIWKVHINAYFAYVSDIFMVEQVLYKLSKFGRNNIFDLFEL